MELLRADRGRDLGEVAEDVRTGTIPRCGHWIAEENPAALLSDLSRFLPLEP